MRFPVPVALLAAFCAWAWITAFFSDFSTIALDQTIDQIKLLVIFIVAVNALRTEKQIRYYLWLYLLCFMLSPGRGALQGYGLGNTVFGRAVWSYNYSNPNDLAAYSLLAIGIALTMASSLQEQRYLRLLGWLSVIVLTLIIFLTQSRGVMLGAAIALGPATLMILRKHPAALIYGCIAAAGVLYFVPQSALDRFADMKYLTSTETIARADEEGSAANRYDIAVAAWEMTLARPISGSGLGTYRPTMARDHPALGYKDTHNTYLNLSAELGFPGLILWCAMIVTVLRMAYRTRKLATQAGIAAGSAWIEMSLVGLLIAGLFGSYSATSYLYLYLGLVWCRGAILKGEADARLAKIR